MVEVMVRLKMEYFEHLQLVNHTMWTASAPPRLSQCLFQENYQKFEYIARLMSLLLKENTILRKAKE